MSNCYDLIIVDVKKAQHIPEVNFLLANVKWKTIVVVENIKRKRTNDGHTDTAKTEHLHRMM